MPGFATVPPGPRSFALLTNPTAGKGAGTRASDQASTLLRARGHQVRQLVGRDADDARDLVARCVSEGQEELVVVGGDGMVHLALQAIQAVQVAGAGAADLRLGLVPAGTGNDVARYLDVPRGDVDAAVEVLLSGEERVLDQARAGGTTYLTVLAAGFDAVVNERANAMRRPRGQLRYTLATLAELRTLRPLHYRLELDGEVEELDATMVAVGNGPSFGGGLRIAEGADLTDGLLDVVVIAPLSRRRLLRTYPTLFRGTHVTDPSFRRIRVRKVRIESPGITAYADGERLGPLPLDVEVVPASLRVVAGPTPGGPR